MSLLEQNLLHALAALLGAAAGPEWPSGSSRSSRVGSEPFRDWHRNALLALNECRVLYQKVGIALSEGGAWIDRGESSLEAITRMAELREEGALYASRRTLTLLYEATAAGLKLTELRASPADTPRAELGERFLELQFGAGASASH